VVRGSRKFELLSHSDQIGQRVGAHPVLTSAQIDRIRPLGHIRSVQSGETLFEPNDLDVPFFVVLSGQMDVSRPTLDGERLVTAHTPGCFNGEMAMISGQRCLVRVTAPGEFLELTRDATGGWGFATFIDGKPSDAASMKSCFPCHNQIKARDLVFTRYAP
jgi:hypothetical protein